MSKPKDYRPLTCAQCLQGAGLDFKISMAFQPIVDIEQRHIYAYEALVRGTQQEPAGEILSRVNDNNRYSFDQACRVKAIELVSQLHHTGRVSINFLPNAIYRPELCIRTTIAAAEKHQFPLENIIFEITEGEKVDDNAHLVRIIQHYQECGFLTAIDDFGAGYSGLNLLVEFKPNIIKLDMFLIRDIDRDKARQAIVKGIVSVCNDLDIQIIAEGIETPEEFKALKSLGIRYYQGYYFAKPAFENLVQVSFEQLAL